MKFKHIITAILIALLLSGCGPSYRPSNPNVHAGDVILITSGTWSTIEQTVTSVTQDGSHIQVDGDKRYWAVDNMEIHIVRCAKK